MKTPYIKLFFIFLISFFTAKSYANYFNSNLTSFLLGDKTQMNQITISGIVKDKESGENRDKTEWHRVVFFGNLAEIAEKYLDKGSSVYVEGKIQTRKWQDKDGNDRWTTEVLGNQLTMLGSRSTSEQSSDTNNSSDAPFPEDDSGPGLTDDDIPF